MANFTKKAIKDALGELLAEKPLSRITVKDIVERCGINRNSFYYHFQDIPSLIEEIVTDEADKIISKYNSVDSLEMMAKAITEFAGSNRRAILHIYNSANRDIFEHYLWKVCDYIVSSYVEAVSKDEPQLSPEDRSAILKFYRSVCFGMVMDYLRSGMKEENSEDLFRIARLNKGYIEYLREGEKN